MLHVRGPNAACDVAERTIERPSVRQAARRASEVTGDSGRRGSAMVQIGAGATGRRRRAASDEAAARFDDTPTDSRDALGSLADSRGFMAHERGPTRDGPNFQRDAEEVRCMTVQ